MSEDEARIALKQVYAALKQVSAAPALPVEKVRTLNLRTLEKTAPELAQLKQCCPDLDLSVNLTYLLPEIEEKGVDSVATAINTFAKALEDNFPAAQININDLWRLKVALGDPKTVKLYNKEVRRVQTMSARQLTLRIRRIKVPEKMEMFSQVLEDAGKQVLADEASAALENLNLK